MINKVMVGLVVLLAAFNLYMWKSMVWRRSITVTGYAKSEVSNQIARFTVGVTALNDDKDAAVEEVKTKMTDIVEIVKGLGISEADIKTTQINVNQMEERADAGSGLSIMPVEPFYPEKMKLGQWNASVTIDVVLRDVTESSEFTEAMNASGATNLYGPTFQLDDDRKFADELIDEAVANARAKAEVMAKTTGARLGKVLSISEDGYQGVTPMYDSGLMRSSELAMPVEAGTSTVSKSVMVTWNIK